MAEDLVKKFNDAWQEDPLRFDALPGVNSSWPAHKVVTLYQMLKMKPKPTQEEIAATVKLERSTISRKSRSVNWDKFEAILARLCTMSPRECLEEAADDQRLEILAGQAIKQRKSDINNLAFMKHLEERILASTEPIEKSKLPPMVARKPKKERTPEHMVLLLSDSHVGQEFSFDDTGGLNEYNLDIYMRRIDNLRNGLRDIRNLHAELYPIPELHILALGDFVQGSNLGGKWGPAYNSTMDISQQAQVAADTLSRVLSEWSTMFEKVTLTGVIGNHGRAGVSITSDKVSANWDNIVYALIESKMSRHKNVVIDRSNSWWRSKNINGTEFVMVHGDHVTGSINSLLREEQRIQSLISGKASKPFQYLCLGHFHSHQEIETSRGGIFVNGSFVGGDVHSMHQLRLTSKPSQTIFGVHPIHGLTWKYNLDLEFHRDEKEEKQRG